MRTSTHVRIPALHSPTMSISYYDDPASLTAAQLEGFFVGWPNPPSPETLLRIMQGSAHVVYAMDEARVIGFITAISDGVLTAFIPLLEVLPEYQGRGVGSELVRRMLSKLGHLYSVDAVCDEDVVAFYQRHGLIRGTAMMHRKYDNQSGRP